MQCKCGIQIQHLLKLNYQLYNLSPLKLKDSNTTLVKVKSHIAPAPFPIFLHSNTTLVKVKWGCKPPTLKSKNEIQIQHLLKLNLSGYLDSCEKIIFKYNTC